MNPESQSLNDFHLKGGNYIEKTLMVRGNRMGKLLTDEEREQRMAEDLWLNYFNRYLFEGGTISEKEYKRMTEKIAARKARHDPERGTR